MQGNDLVELKAFLAFLVRACRESLNGSLYFVSSNKRAGAIGVEAGKIVGIRYLAKYNDAAIDEIKQIDRLQFRFAEGSAFKVERGTLADNSAILDRLGCGEVVRDLPASGARSVLAPEYRTIPEPELRPAGADSTSKLKLSILRILLTNYVGPVAGLMCDRLLDRGVDFETAIDELTQKVPDPEDAKRFAMDAHYIPDAFLIQLQDLAVYYLGPVGVTASDAVFARSDTVAEAIVTLAGQLDKRSAAEFERGAKKLLAEHELG